jgi:hypothetical protein
MDIPEVPVEVEQDITQAQLEAQEMAQEVP